ncbi:MAG TPA: hypothetical protein VEA80_05640 [Vitreimonas sp.]|uniref:hypothetical protein n=1 Tax=Vitreimonas sp. TaxID=3069702 RepID=UPI002D50FC2A|nr:hypothetical protein [Vitreimonas sp.]HYD86934.1 hypothetical protein [Vitreimonas sp.]
MQRLVPLVPKLLREIANTPLRTAVAFVAPLLLLPQFHANTIRLEALLHLIVARGGVSGRLRKTMLADWLNQQVRAGPFAYVEDPPEDVFVGNVSLREGDFKVLLGVYEGADFHVQTLLEVLETIPTGPLQATLWKPVLALLKLSDAMLSRGGLERQTVGGGTHNGRMALPSDPDYARARKLLAFSAAELLELGIDEAFLRPFVFDMTRREALLTQELGWSSLDRAPLLRLEGDLLFALPSATTVAIRSFALDWCRQNGVMEVLQRKIVGRQQEQVFSAARSFRTTAPPQMDGDESRQGDFLSFVAMFDTDKFVHFLCLFDDMQASLDDGLGGRMTIPADKVKAHVSEIIAQCRNAVPRSTGFTIVILAGVGRGHFFGFDDSISGWPRIGLSLHDLETLSHLPDFDLLSLWKMLQQGTRLQDANIQLMNFSGILNELAYWRASDRQMLPSEMSNTGPGLITLPTNALLDIRHEVRRGLDLHASPYLGEHIRVGRESVSPYFKEVADLPVYVSYEGAQEGRLIGVVESPHTNIWVELSEAPKGHYRQFAYLIWSAVLRWMLRVAEIMEIPTEGPIRRVVISFNDAESWPVTVFKDTQRPSGPAVESSGAHDDVRLVVNQALLFDLRQEKNVGERAVVSAIVQTLTGLAPTAADEAARKICINDDARFIHVMSAHSYLDHVEARGTTRPWYVDEADVSDARVGLVKRALNPCPPPGNLTGKQECGACLNACVEQLWTEIRDVLDDTSETELLTMCFENLTRLAVEEQEWIKTARAVLALHSDKADVHRAALEQESKRNGASLAIRILAEMAACHSNAAGAAVSRSAFESLIGKVSLLIEFGQYSDAMHGGFIQPSLTVYPSGEVSVENQFFSEVQLPRQRASFHSQYEGAAARYGALFESTPEGRTAGDLFGAQYAAAFMDEFQITPETLKAFSQELEQTGIDEDSQSLIMSRQGLAAHMKDVDPTVADRVITRLTLPRRSSWDSVPAGGGFRSRDWYPWKYRRQLSLLARPFIELRDGTLLVSPYQASMAFRYLVMGAFDASLGEEHFKSDAMVRWIGKKRADRGVAFNVSVAEQIGEAGFEATPNVLVKSISGKKGDEGLGDIDALAWSKADNVVAIVECKDLFFAKTAGEAAEQLSNFRGGADKKGRPDELTKHLQRVQWAEVNATLLQRFLKLPNEPKIVDLVVFSRNVPMTYYNGFSGGSARFCETADLPGRLSSLFAQR